jgi:hypothetical protein
MRQSKRCFEKYDIEVLSLEGSYLRTDARRAVIRDRDETCSVEEYACRHFCRRGYCAVRVENDPIFALFGVLMWPVIQDPSDPRRRSVGVFDRRAVDAGVKIVWTHHPSDFGKPEYGVRRAKAIEKHLSAIACKPRELRQLFDLWLCPSDELGLYLGGRQTEHIQVSRQLIEIDACISPQVRTPNAQGDERDADRQHRRSAGFDRIVRAQLSAESLSQR